MEYIAVNKSSYFEHHGRLGQRWGKKNGPPYPLDYKKLSAEEREQDKKRTIREGDIVNASYNKNFYTNQELNDVKTRYELNNNIDNLSSKKINAGKKTVQDYINTMDTIGKVGSKLGEAITGGTKAYNSVALLMNAFGDKNLPIVGQKKGNK